MSPELQIRWKCSPLPRIVIFLAAPVLFTSPNLSAKGGAPHTPAPTVNLNDLLENDAALVSARLSPVAITVMSSTGPAPQLSASLTGAAEQATLAKFEEPILLSSRPVEVVQKGRNAIQFCFECFRSGEFLPYLSCHTTSPTDAAQFCTTGSRVAFSNPDQLMPDAQSPHCAFRGVSETQKELQYRQIIEELYAAAGGEKQARCYSNSTKRRDLLKTMQIKNICSETKTDVPIEIAEATDTLWRRLEKKPGTCVDLVKQKLPTIEPIMVKPDLPTVAPAKICPPEPPRVVATTPRNRPQTAPTTTPRSHPQEPRRPQPPSIQPLRETQCSINYYTDPAFPGDSLVWLAFHSEGTCQTGYRVVLLRHKLDEPIGPGVPAYTLGLTDCIDGHFSMTPHFAPSDMNQNPILVQFDPKIRHAVVTESSTSKCPENDNVAFRVQLNHLETKPPELPNADTTITCVEDGKPSSISRNSLRPGFHCKTPEGGDWTLAARASRGDQVWKDERTDLYWTRQIATRFEDAATLCTDEKSLEARAGRTDLIWKLKAVEEFPQALNHGLMSVIQDVSGFPDAENVALFPVTGVFCVGRAK